MTEELKTLRLEGALTIKTAPKTHDLLLAAFLEAKAAGQPLEVDIADDCDCDLTLPQMLLSAQEMAAKQGVDFRINAGGQSPFFTTLERTGLSAAIKGGSVTITNGDQR